MWYFTLKLSCFNSQKWNAMRSFRLLDFLKVESGGSFEQRIFTFSCTNPFTHYNFINCRYHTSINLKKRHTNRQICLYNASPSERYLFGNTYILIIIYFCIEHKFFHLNHHFVSLYSLQA